MPKKETKPVAPTPKKKEVEKEVVVEVKKPKAPTNLGTIGGQKIIEVGKRTVNGVEYNELLTANGIRYVLSDRDVEEQVH